MRQLVLFISLSLTGSFIYGQDSTSIAEQIIWLEKLAKEPIIKDTTYLITAENFPELNLQGGPFVPSVIPTIISSPYSLVGAMIGGQLIPQNSLVPDELTKKLLNKTCRVQYHGIYHVKITTQEETPITLFYIANNNFPYNRDIEEIMIFPYDCNPMNFYAIQQKIDALDERIKTMEQRERINLNGEYILLYGTEYHEEIYHFDCKYYGDSTDIYTGKELKLLTQEMNGRAWTYNDEYVVIHQFHNYIGGINRWHIVRLYFERIDN